MSEEEPQQTGELLQKLNNGRRSTSSEGNWN